MKNLISIILLFSSISYSQDQKKAWLDKGNLAFSDKDFEKAREAFSAAVAIDSTYRDALFNLAVTEASLEHQDKACLLFQKCYKLKDKDVGKIIKEYCGKIDYNPIMFFEDVDVKPQIILDGKPYPILKDGKINSTFENKIIIGLRGSRLIKTTNITKIYLILTVTKFGMLQCEIIRVNGTASPEFRAEITRILQGISTFSPAQYQGKSVETWGGYMLPINF